MLRRRDPVALAERGTVEVSGPVRAHLVHLYRLMRLSRAIEDRLHTLYRQGQLQGRLISGRGQEAIPVGFAAATDERDVVCPVHRDLGAHLARGTTAEEVFLHYLGRQASASRGRDGDIHFGLWGKGVFPMISHLPDSWPVAVGMALASQLSGDGGVVVAFCGDGATSTGAWHEALNTAAVWRVPVVFVVENNHYAYSTPTGLQYRVAHIAERAAAYGIEGRNVDGNDVEAVYEVAREAVERARRGDGPVLVEAVTMRMDGHAVHDPAGYVPPELLEEWHRRDPIASTERRLLARRWLGGDEVEAIGRQVQQEVADAYRRAAAAEPADPDQLEEGVFAAPPPPPSTAPEFR